MNEDNSLMGKLKGPLHYDQFVGKIKELGPISKEGLSNISKPLSNLLNQAKQEIQYNDSNSSSSAQDDSDNDQSSNAGFKKSFKSSNQSSSSGELDERLISSDKQMESLVCSTDELFQQKIPESEEEQQMVNMLFDNPYKQKNKLVNKCQDDIMFAIETLNYALFIDLGASEETNINFYKNVAGSQVSPIMAAAAKGSEEMLRLILLNKTLDINACNDQGVNAFWIACLYGHGNIMSTLGNLGINVMIKNKKNVNVMHLAVEKNYTKIVDLLLQSDFSLTEETDNGMTALQIGAYRGHTQVIQSIINYLKRNKDSELMDLVLNKVNSKSHLSTLAYSILHRHYNISSLLIEFGAQSYYGETDEQKDFSPIFMAVQELNTELLEQMMDHGASLTVKNSVGMTPLMFAAEQNYHSIVNYLSLRTRDLNEEDANCITILVHQLFSGNFLMASRLIVRGAQIDYVNKNGNTALHLCVENQLTEAVEFLLFNGANQHIMDLNYEDACDKAKKNGVAQKFPQFNNCNITKKIVPELPEGVKMDQTKMPEYFRENKLPLQKSATTLKSVQSQPKIMSKKSMVNISQKQETFAQNTFARQESFGKFQETPQNIYFAETPNHTTMPTLTNSNTVPNLPQIRSLTMLPTISDDKILQKMEKISTTQISEMKNIANDLNLDFKHQLQLEKDERKREFIQFKNQQIKNQQSLFQMMQNEQIKESKNQFIQIQNNIGQQSHVKNVQEKQEKNQMQEIKEYTEKQNKILMSQIREEMKVNNKYLEGLIMKQNSNIMQNGLQSILDLNNKIDKYNQIQKPKKKKQMQPLRIDSAPVMKKKNYSQGIDKFMDLSQGSFNGEIEYAENMLQGLEQQVNQALSRLDTQENDSRKSNKKKKL